MRRGNSLRLRLLLGAGLALAVTLLIAGASLYFVFERYVEQVALQQLQNQFSQLALNLTIDSGDRVALTGPLSDPRFSKPYGGLYWQVNRPQWPPLRSRSLWDDTLPASDAADGTVHMIAGPDGAQLFALERHVGVADVTGHNHPLAVTIAIDRSEIDGSTNGFGRELAIGLLLLFFTLLASSLIQTLFGLAPLESMRRGVEAIMAGRSKALAGDFPGEVEPLVDELNLLLASRDRELDRARLRAANLAHGLKTPLTVMSAVADDLAATGQGKIATEIREGASQMRHLVERELARARIASGQTSPETEIAPVVTRMINALKRTSNKSDLRWKSNIPMQAKLPVEPDDLLEIVGNLLDNAQKWARSQVGVSWQHECLVIEDDGTGVADSQLQLIQRGGVRLDENVPGTGLGLGIVRDLCEAYKLDMELKRSKLGGLSVSVCRRKKINPSE